MTGGSAGVDEREIEARLSRLDLEQKVRLLTGADFWSLHAEPEVGLRRLVVSDGPVGVRGEVWDERDTSVNVPSPTALAASWDLSLVERVGVLLAAEARRKGIDVLLAPTVNLHRTPYGGRHFECFSEDPFLTGQIGAAYVRGVQSGGVGATVKHLVANDSETDRMTVDVHVDERTLRELYLAPFETIVREAGAWAVMAAYNQVNGVTMTESPLVREVLQQEWGFDGLTVSDWMATRSTDATARAGLDLAMPGPGGPWGEALVESVRAGRVDEAHVDDHVRRVLRLAARVGALAGVGPQPGTPAAAGLAPDDAGRLVRAAAGAGAVLLRNDGVLPLAATSLRHVAVLGPNAETGRPLGGGSATVHPPYTVSPLDGLRAALGAAGTTVELAPGVRAHERAAPARTALTRAPDGSPGVEVRLLAADGTLLLAEHRTGGVFNWLGGFGALEGVRRVEVHTSVGGAGAGTYDVGGAVLGSLRLEVGGEVVFDEWLSLPPGADIVDAIMAPPQRVAPVTVAAGEFVPVVLSHDVLAPGEGPGAEIGTVLHLDVEPPFGPEQQEFDRAVALARKSDVAVVVVGTNEEVESEGHDRTTLRLPGRQDELVRAVAAVNPRTVVVVNAGAPVLLPWVDQVAAVLVTWFPGQEFGNALADVLLGSVEPGGRLPVTWPASELDLPRTQPVDGVLSYAEGLHVGYRDSARSHAFPFGHGLGYTRWDFRSARVTTTADEHPERDLTVEVELENTGERTGREVVQVYVSRTDSAVDRPRRWLAGFAVVEGGPGPAVAEVPLPSRAFEHWDGARRQWVVESGTFVVEIGRSSVDLPLQVSLVVP